MAGAALKISANTDLILTQGYEVDSILFILIQFVRKPKAKKAKWFAP